jgi:MFS transporter, DHA1 family, multidrug resistance protein
MVASMSFFLGLCRPPTNNLILEQVDQDIGAAFSLVIFTFMMIDSVYHLPLHGLIKSLSWELWARFPAVLPSFSGSGTAVFL